MESKVVLLVEVFEAEKYCVYSLPYAQYVPLGSAIAHKVPEIGHALAIAVHGICQVYSVTHLSEGSGSGILPELQWCTTDGNVSSNVMGYRLCIVPEQVPESIVIPEERILKPFLEYTQYG